MELVAAARSGRTNDVRRLLDEGGRVDDEGEAGGSPLWYACAGGHYECAKLLLLRGAAVDRERDGTTPLLVACQNGRLDVCELLIERGASIATPTTSGLSALNTAARGGHADIVALLRAPVRKGSRVWHPASLVDVLTGSRGASRGVRKLLSRAKSRRSTATPTSSNCSTPSRAATRRRHPPSRPSSTSPSTASR